MLLLMDLQVVKNVSTRSLEVKKLVYLYLLHYAEKYVHIATWFPIFQFITCDNVTSKSWKYCLLMVNGIMLITLKAYFSF